MSDVLLEELWFVSRIVGQAGGPLLASEYNAAFLTASREEN